MTVTNDHTGDILIPGEAGTPRPGTPRPGTPSSIASGEFPATKVSIVYSCMHLYTNKLTPVFETDFFHSFLLKKNFFLLHENDFLYPANYLISINNVDKELASVLQVYAWFRVWVELINKILFICKLEQCHFVNIKLTVFIQLC